MISCIHYQSNHPPSMLNFLLKEIEIRLSADSTNVDIFQEAAMPYNNALKNNGHKEELKYINKRTTKDTHTHTYIHIYIYIYICIHIYPLPLSTSLSLSLSPSTLRNQLTNQPNKHTLSLSLPLSLHLSLPLPLSLQLSLPLVSHYLF